MLHVVEWLVLLFVVIAGGFNVVTFAIAFGRGPRPRGLWTALGKEMLATLVLIPAWPLFAFIGATYRARTRSTGDGDHSRTHIVLLHGYMMNRTNWLWLGPHLARRGLGPLHGLSYFTLQPIADSARRLAAYVEALAKREGIERVDLVGHSMGGLVARYYIEKLGGAARVRRLITIATPHHGTRLGRLAIGAARREIVPGSPHCAPFTGAPEGVDYTSIWSRADNLVVPPESAQLTPMPPEEGEAQFYDSGDDSCGSVFDDVVFDDLGHLGLLVSPRVAEAICSRLQAA